LLFRETLDGVMSQLRQELEQVADLGASGARFEELIGVVRKATDRAGLEVLRAGIEALDDPVSTVEREGACLRFRGTATKRWLTPFGPMTVERRIYAGQRTGTFAPLDARCGMVDRYLAPQVEDLACFASASMTPTEVEELLTKALPRAPSATAIKRAIAEVGGLLDTHGEHVEAVISKERPLRADGEIVVASWDGCMLAMRGEKQAEWKEAGVGRVSIYRPGGEAPEMIDSRCYAQMPEPGMTTLVECVVASIAELRKRDGIRELVVICDGKPSIWTTAAKLPELAGATHILDFYHAMQHVTVATKAITGGNDIAAKRLSERWREKLQLEHDGVDKIIRAIGRYIAKTKPGSEPHAALTRARKHFMNNRERMRYADFINRGLPIGSGPIEAACKTIVQHRLKRSGMTWSTTGGQHVLNLRALVKSGRWAPAWRALRDLACATR
jgi:Uncharacterised protein family (UPF0236)